MAATLGGLPAVAQQGGDTQQTVASTAKPLETVRIYGEQGKTDTATRLNLTLFETPQTVTAIPRAQMDDFAFNNISDLLNYTPGVTVEEVETDRTDHTARGFDIVNFQYGGVGICRHRRHRRGQGEGYGLERAARATLVRAGVRPVQGGVFHRG